MSASWPTCTGCKASMPHSKRRCYRCKKMKSAPPAEEAIPRGSDIAPSSPEPSATWRGSASWWPESKAHASWWSGWKSGSPAEDDQTRWSRPGGGLGAAHYPTSVGAQTQAPQLNPAASEAQWNWARILLGLCNWHALRSADGRVYYWDMLRNSVQWKPPVSHSRRSAVAARGVQGPSPSRARRQPLPAPQCQQLAAVTCHTTPWPRKQDRPLNRQL